MASFGGLGRRRAGRWTAASLIAAVTLAGGQLGVPSAWASVAVAGSKWSMEPTPNAQLANGKLGADSCAGPDSCVAVGSYESSSNTSALAEAWNGTTWRIQAVPVPPGGTHSALDGVSCTAVTACTAVGYYTGSQGHRVSLAERWNGTSWSAQPTPDPATAHYSVLTSVSCGSATSCVAVGYYKYGSTGVARLAEAWNGTAWSIKQSSNPPNGTYGVLDGVSCAMATACVAVGNYLEFSSDDTLTLAEVWNGRAWSIQPTPAPRSGTNSIFDGVSPITASSFIAVGSHASSAGVAVTLAETGPG